MSVSYKLTSKINKFAFGLQRSFMFVYRTNLIIGFKKTYSAFALFVWQNKTISWSVVVYQMPVIYIY